MANMISKMAFLPMAKTTVNGLFLPGRQGIAGSLPRPVE
jgi:hypothetical protein